MSLNNYEWIEDSPSLSQSREESQEQYQERAKKAQSQLKKIQKDEKRAQWDDEKLFLILYRFIQDEYYKSLIHNVTSLLSLGVPSRWVISFISLFYPDATYYVVDSLGKPEKLNLLLSLPRYETLTEFNEQDIRIEIRNWISEWIILMESFLLHESSSLLMSKKFMNLLSGEYASKVEENLSDFLKFFFAMRNISISNEKSREYARFIQKNISQKIQSFLSLQEKNLQELITDSNLTADDLFGI